MSSEETKCSSIRKGETAISVADTDRNFSLQSRVAYGALVAHLVQCSTGGTVYQFLVIMLYIATPKRAQLFISISKIYTHYTQALMLTYIRNS